MAPMAIRFELPDQGYDDKYILPPTHVSLKRKPSTTSTYCSSTAYSTSSSASWQDDGSCHSSITSRHSIGYMERSNDNNNINKNHTRRIEEERPYVEFITNYSNKGEVKNDSEDSTTAEAETKNRSLSLDFWDHGSNNIQSSSSVTTDGEFQLPIGISKADIMVTIDIDDEARSSRVEELDEGDLDVEVLHNSNTDTHCNSSNSSPRKQCHRGRRLEFEETVRDGILDDLTSVYTATPETAKLVLCVIISVLSDGSLEHTFWSGGRTGLTEISLQWMLFDADDLTVYKSGITVQKKDLGFGHLELTDTEGGHYLATTLAPRAANHIMRQVGQGVNQDLLVEC
ncbi:MAG: hypothetical protein ACI8RD_004455 [Bacillariaceae sp.]|jgi:hypothetical protein